MGSVCSLTREPGPGDEWIWSPNATVLFGEGNSTVNISSFESLLLRMNYCKASSLKFDPATEITLIGAYLMFILFGALGNGLVCYIVLANCHMRTPRNLLILNLATSDLILCVFTQPFNLLKASTSTWKLGAVMCKLVPMTAGTNVFVSTFSITAIALDRFRLIVRPTDKDLLLQPIWSATVLVSIWLLSLLLSSPMLVFNTIQHNKMASSWLCISEICYEDPQYASLKSAYSVVSLLIQYILPIIILSVAHARICNKLQHRMNNATQLQHLTIPQHQNFHHQQQQQQQQRLLSRNQSDQYSNQVSGLCMSDQNTFLLKHDSNWQASKINDSQPQLRQQEQQQQLLFKSPKQQLQQSCQLQLNSFSNESYCCSTTTLTTTTTTVTSMVTLSSTASTTTATTALTSPLTSILTEECKMTDEEETLPDNATNIATINTTLSLSTSALTLTTTTLSLIMSLQPSSATTTSTSSTTTSITMSTSSTTTTASTTTTTTTLTTIYLADSHNNADDSPGDEIDDEEDDDNILEEQASSSAKVGFLDQSIIYTLLTSNFEPSAY